MALRFLNNGYFAGKVGIGTDSPSSQLSIGANAITTKKPTVAIVDGVAGGSLLIRGLSPILSFDKTSTGVPKILMDTGGLQFKTGTLDAEGDIDMVILPNGNVGIGTDSPQSKLDVKLSNDTTASIGGTISAGSFAGLAFGYSEAGNANYRHSAIVFERDDASFGDARGKIHILNSPSGSASADLGDSRLTILPNGNVGIGTDNPDYKLEVQGEAGIELYNGTGGGNVLNFRPSLGDANKYNMSISSYDHSGSGVGPADGLSINGYDGVSFATGSSTSREERMRINASGNVGIGMTTPRDKLNLFDAGDNVGMYFHTTTSGTAGGDGLRVGQNNANAFVWNYEATSLAFATSGTARLTINASGGVRFNTGYGAGTLVTDASGNITSTSTPPGTGTFLPLAGGTMDSGATITTSGTLSIVGNSAVKLRVSGGARIQLENANVTDSFYISNTGGNLASTLDLGGTLSIIEGGAATFAGDVLVEDNLYLTDAGTVRGKLILNASDRDNVELRAESLGSTMKFFTVGTQALLLDASQNATFAGNVTLAKAGTPLISLTDTTNNVNLLIGADDANTFFRSSAGTMFFQTGGSTTALTLNASQNATFAAQAFSAATSSGDASSTLTTKGYVDGLITGATIYRGAWDPSGGGYGSPDLSGVTQTSGYYYICSAAGTAEPNGTGTEPDSWEVGDWVIYNDVSGTGQWQKIDNSSVLSGVGTGQTVALWEGPGSVTDSDTLGNSIITQSGATVASSQITLSSTSDAQLRLFSTNSWSGIYFDDFGSNPDHIWHNADAGTFALGGGGSNVINKKLHVHGGVTIGSGYAATAPPANGLSVEGNVSIGSSVINVERLYVEGKQYIESQGVDWNETTPGLTRGALHFDPVGDGAANTGNAITFGASDASNGTNGHAGIYTRSDGSYGTKMYFATTDSYALGSKTRMMIDSDGNVGIGTTSPDTLLQATNTADGTDYISYEIGSTEINVDNRGGFAIYELGTLQGSLEYYRDGTGRVQMASYGAGNPVTFATTASGETALGERMRIIPDGTVVIGATTVGYNTTQGYPLGVMSDLTSQSYISVARKGQTLGSDGLVLGLDTNNAYLQVRDSIPLILGTNNSSKVWILPSGHVGINVTAPAAMLDVQPTSTDRKVTRIANDVMSTYFYNTQVDAILAWTCGSYYQAEVVITANQTNGGTYNNLYIRGIWSNNHTSHHWDELERIGSLTGSTFTISVGQNGATTASGRLELDFDYLSGSFSQLNVRVTDFYGSHNYTIT